MPLSRWSCAELAAELVARSVVAAISPATAWRVLHGDAIQYPGPLPLPPDSPAGVIAWAGPTAVAAGRVEFHRATDFAGLWGGGTLPAWRGPGVFRALVAHRGAEASARGFRYLEVDAPPPSRPILQRLGFVDLAITTPFMHPSGAG